MAGALVLLAVVLGRAQEVQYYDHHYTKSTCSCRTAARRKPMTSPASTTSGSGSPARARSSSASTGSTAPTWTTTSSTSACPGAAEAYRLATRCQQFRRRINAGDYDYLIISQYTQDSPDAPYWYPIYAWVKTAPQLKLVIEEPEITPRARLRLQGERQAGSGGLQRPHQELTSSNLEP